jgi:hypothetical protein
MLTCMPGGGEPAQPRLNSLIVVMRIVVFWHLASASCGPLNHSDANEAVTSASRLGVLGAKRVVNQYFRAA